MRFGGVVAVDDASVTVAPGEIVGLIGPNGAGKTTLIDAITGFVKPATGSIVVNGEAIDSCPSTSAPAAASAARSSSSSCSRAAPCART